MVLQKDLDTIWEEQERFYREMENLKRGIGRPRSSRHKAKRLSPAKPLKRKRPSTQK